jgi:hypothetical protein
MSDTVKAWKFNRDHKGDSVLNSGQRLIKKELRYIGRTREGRERYVGRAHALSNLRALCRAHHEVAERKAEGNRPGGGRRPPRGMGVESL